MSRKYKHIDERFTIYFGSDHSIGEFIQLVDNTFNEDASEEGYIFEFDEVFGVTQNFIPNIDASTITSIDMARRTIYDFLAQNSAHEEER